MNRLHMRRAGVALGSVLLAACASTPEPVATKVVAVQAPVAEKEIRIVKVDETAMLPLLGYLQLLARMSPQDQARERKVLTAIPQTPAVRVRLAMLLAQGRASTGLAQAQNLLDGILKSNEPTAASLHPLARLLSSHYSERLRLGAQNAKQAEQIEQLAQELKDSQNLSVDLQQKINALADIERTLPARPVAGANKSISESER